MFKKTHDNWHGNHNGDEIVLRLSDDINRPFRNEKPDIGPLYRVAAWGNDDFGMIIDIADEQEARELFDMLSKRSYIDKEDLDELGFDTF